MAKRKDPGPDLAAWRTLYEEAALFCALAPWQWLENEDLFAVEHPETKELAFCVVMGAAGMEFGLLAHRGLEGLLVHTLAMNELLDDDEVLLRSSHLSFSLGDREDMRSHDRSIQAALGLKFRGRQAWPLFRSTRPAYLPTALEEDEAAFLTICLEQAGEVRRWVQRSPRAERRE